jgi:hypothetical protein
MRVTDRQRWLLLAGVASFAAAQLASEAMSMTFRLAAGDDPPEDPNERGFNWTTALVFGAATGAVVSLAELAARRSALTGWKKVKGRRPPRAKRR